MNDNSYALNLLSTMLQILSYEMILTDVNNTDILRYLKHQDNDLLETIIKQNEQIIELLKGGNEDE